MNYRVSGLSAAPFKHLYGLNDNELAKHGVKRYVANKSPGFPDRISMRDAEVGETLLLLNFEHQPVESPYQSKHAIYVLEGAEETYVEDNTIPEVMSSRLQAIRAFDEDGMIVDAEVAEGEAIEKIVLEFLENPKVAYLQTHNAKRGCYSGRIDRA